MRGVPTGFVSIIRVVLAQSPCLLEMKSYCALQADLE